MEMIAEHLGLSDEQKAQWKAIHEKAREEGQPLMKAAGGAKEAFDKALESDNPDAAVIGQAAIAMSNARRKVEDHQKATFAEVKAILTPEQLAKVEDMEKHMRRPGPGGPGFGPDGHQGAGPGGPGVRKPKGPDGSK
jgi:Spy/CpxP family protein refolding chaperone